jgi:serine/threonine-protein kinase
MPEERNITFHSLSNSGPSRVRPGESVFQLRSADVHGRLAYLAFFYTLGFTLAYGFGVVTSGQLGWKLFTHLPSVIAMVCILSAVVLFIMARWKLVSDVVLTRIALIWIVPAILGILIAENWIWMALKPDVMKIGMEQKVNFGISWTCVTISIFPLLVSASVIQVAISSFAAAAMGPFYLLIFSWYHQVPLPGIAIVGVSYPMFICAVIAVGAGVVMSRYRKDVDQARQLGSYRLVDRLGKGGMGEVWRAKHQMLVRPAAIKLIRPGALGTAQTDDSSDSHILRRFEREVQATASLQSPHTISVYDFGVTDEGSFYYVMELLDGLDTDTLVEKFGPLPEGRVVNLLKQVCDSLAEAHHHGLIHRDIKPANIFVCRWGLKHDFVKVLDFGLVKTAEESKRDDAKLTAQGVATGTPAYMAPEVALARPDLDGRLDIYSLGCVAYWLVTGKQVFEADTPMALALKHVKDEPVPPSRRTEMEIGAEVEKMIMSCLEKEPSKRPQSAQDLLARLEACPVSDPWDSKRAGDWWEKHLPETSRTA